MRLNRQHFVVDGHIALLWLIGLLMHAITTYMQPDAEIYIVCIQAMLKPYTGCIYGYHLVLRRQLAYRGHAAGPAQLVLDLMV